MRRMSSSCASDGICRYRLSYRDVEEMMRERGLDVDPSTVFRWYRDTPPKFTNGFDLIGA